IDEALALKVDGVSGATFSSRAIIGNVQAGLRYAAQNAEKPSLSEKIDLSAKNIAGIIVVLMAAIVPLFYKKKRYRMVQMVLNIGILGFWCGTFLSYSLFVGYMSNGIHVLTSLIAVIMLVMAFVYPLFGKKNYYCVNVCPYGALQELAGKTKIKKWKLSARTVAYLTTFRKVLWGLLMAMMLAGVGFEWMDYEVFSAFIMTSASVVVLCMAVVFFILSLFVPRPYCRFVCPTGTLFKITQNSK
ncbi:MAG TPA: 4Fe-4S binding protein, partial [Prevotella sp.]